MAIDSSIFYHLSPNLSCLLLVGGSGNCSFKRLHQPKRNNDNSNRYLMQHLYCACVVALLSATVGKGISDVASRAPRDENRSSRCRALEVLSLLYIKVCTVNQKLSAGLLQNSLLKHPCCLLARSPEKSAKSAWGLSAPVAQKHPRESKTNFTCCQRPALVALPIFFSLTEAPLPDPTPTPPNTPKRTRNGPETDPKRSQTEPNGAETEPNGAETDRNQAFRGGTGGGFVGVGGVGGL